MKITRNMLASALNELKCVMVYEQDGWDGIGNADTREQQVQRIESAIEQAEELLHKYNKEAV